MRLSEIANAYTSSYPFHNQSTRIQKEKVISTKFMGGSIVLYEKTWIKKRYDNMINLSKEIVPYA